MPLFLVVSAHNGLIVAGLGSPIRSEEGAHKMAHLLGLRKFSKPRKDGTAPKNSYYIKPLDTEAPSCQQ